MDSAVELEGIEAVAEQKGWTLHIRVFRETDQTGPHWRLVGETDAGTVLLSYPFQCEEMPWLRGLYVESTDRLTALAIKDWKWPIPEGPAIHFGPAPVQTQEEG